MDSRGRLLWRTKTPEKKLISVGVDDIEVVSSVVRNDMNKPSSVIVDTPKFELVANLGIITIPPDNSLATFNKNNRGKFYYYNPNITDDNFSNPTHILKPGDKLRVRAFKQVVPGTTTSECLAFLKSQNALLVGAQGIPPVFEQKCDLLPKGYWHTSFDNKSRLWCSGGDHRVPFVSAYSGGDFGFGLGAFESPWGAGGCLLCFCLPAEASA